MPITARGLRALFCLSFALFLVACATQTGRDSAQPVQSPNDDYQYRLLTLDNELQLLLISDPDTPKAAASLTVMVGSGDNPPGRAGLAHFLEHMLFLGTDKYPDPAEYERYITEHGGTRNAYTSFDHTNYFFGVNAEFLPEALDRFAQFFIAPRFDAEYVDREKNAVQAEFQMGLKSDGRRGLDVLQEVMNPEHPYSQFTVGSLETLADREEATIREDLLRFYDKYYSANIMRLAVIGSQPLDELEALVVPMFSQVPNKSFEHEEIEEPIFQPDRLPQLVQIKPLATLRQLEVSFPIADYRGNYHTKPVDYMGNLVGHEGEGSLLSQLKREGLAESLSAGSSLGWRGGSLFSVNIALTETGVQQRNRVLQLLFAYLEMVRDEGPQRWLYEEEARLSELSFRFREPGSPVGYVTGLSSSMHHYAPQDVLRGPYIMDDYNARLMREVANGLRPENALVVFHDAAVETDRASAYYEVPYATAPLQPDVLQLPADDPARAALFLPSRNEFIAEDVALVKHAAPVPDIPAVQYEADRQRLWYMPDDEFRVPRGVIAINFRSDTVGNTARQAALASLYAAVAMDDVNEFSYPARLAGLSFSFYKHAQGLSLRVSGYNDKQQLLLQRLLTALRAADFDEQRFANIRDDMIRALGNTAAKRPSSQVMDDLREALWYGRWNEDALIEVLQGTELQDLTAYVEQFWAGATAEGLVYGNYTDNAVASVASMLDEVMPDVAAPTQPDVKIVRLQAGDALQYRVDIEHDDALLAWYLQGAERSWRDRAATALTAQIMKSGFFQELRTEQQLGYVVSAFNWTQNTVPGLVMLIQSPVADAGALSLAMQEFMEGVLPGIDEQQFARHKAALRSEILRPHKNLRERGDFYWQSIAHRELQFDGREALARALEELTIEDWQRYYRSVFLQRRHSLQVVAPGRWGVFPGGAVEVFETADEVRSGRPVYRLP
ncbi:MAG: insulinase family protein [Halioglobus sp.]